MAARTIFTILLALALPGIVGAQDAPIVTRHHLREDGRLVTYLAQVGRLPVRSSPSRPPHGLIFYAAYRVRSAGVAGAPRPILFLWGGGPSDPALGLQSVFGPKRVAGGEIVDNPLTLLGAADLVFVDPVGTGFSRAIKPEYEAEFYNVLGDQASLADFVRSWRAHYADPRSPIFLYGVSYGTWRVSGVADLLEREGIHVAGAILQSGGIQFGLDALPRAVRTALRVPGYASAALAHGKLAPDSGADPDSVSAAARRWALDVYAPALEHVASLTHAERGGIARRLSQVTGYPPSRIDPATLTFTPRAYLRGLLPGDTLDMYDMRYVRGPEDTLDAIYRRGLPPMVAYLRHDLADSTSLAYLGVERAPASASGAPAPSPGERWEYNSGTITPEVMAAARAGEGPPGTEPWLRRAMALDPGLRVLVGAGLYDSLNSCSANEVLMGTIPRDVADRFTLECYPSGHDFHRDPAVAPRFIADTRAFIANAVSGGTHHQER